ncbi:Pectinesterase inhibitor 9 [Linum grandiflorum]
MATTQYVLPLLTLLILTVGVTSKNSSSSSSNPYIVKQCQTTRYPSLCVQCLSTFANSTSHHSPQQLARIALTVSLYRARLTRSFLVKVNHNLKALTKPRDYQVLNDCLGQLADGIQQLSRSILELAKLEKGARNDDVYWHVRNVESWLSAAQTDADTCLNEFHGRKMSKLRATIKVRVMNVAETASNALALFQRFVVARFGAGFASRRQRYP